jgi:hypothetical protein
VLRLAEIETVRGTHAPGYLYIKEIGVFVHEMLLPVVKEIIRELATPELKDRPHGRCSTNNAGCSGPLCLFARRKWWYSNYARKREAAGKQYKQRYNATHELTALVFELFILKENARWEQIKLAAELEKFLDNEPEADSTVQDTNTPPLMIPVLVDA